MSADNSVKLSTCRSWKVPRDHFRSEDAWSMRCNRAAQTPRGTYNIAAKLTDREWNSCSQITIAMAGNQTPKIIIYDNRDRHRGSDAHLWNESVRLLWKNFKRMKIRDKAQSLQSKKECGENFQLHRIFMRKLRWYQEKTTYIRKIFVVYWGHGSKVADK